MVSHSHSWIFRNAQASNDEGWGLSNEVIIEWECWTCNKLKTKAVRP